MPTSGIDVYSLLVLDSLCEPVGWGPLMVVTDRSNCFVSITSKPIQLAGF